MSKIGVRPGLICLAMLAIIVAANWFLPARPKPTVFPHAQIAAMTAAGGVTPKIFVVQAENPAKTPKSSGATGPISGAPDPGSAVIVAYGNSALAAWLITLVAMIIVVAEIGVALNDRPAGAFIDARNRMSLSKLQMVGWTVLILSGVTTLAALMLGGYYAAPATITIDTQMLALMGISFGSAAATPALLSLKDPGVIDRRDAATKAMWTDLFQGDETGNAMAPDISKIQQFAISLLVMAIFGFQFANILQSGYMGTPAPVPTPLSLPVLGSSLVWLIGVSQAGYLGYKGVSHTPPASGDGAATDDGAAG